MGTNAPKRSVTGFHASLTRKPKPKVPSAGQAPATSAMMIPANIRSTNSAQAKVRRLKLRSARFERRMGAELSKAGRSWVKAMSTMECSEEVDLQKDRSGRPYQKAAFPLPFPQSAAARQFSSKQGRSAFSEEPFTD